MHLGAGVHSDGPQSSAGICAWHRRGLAAWEEQSFHLGVLDNSLRLLST